jgi:hypothetical protein
MFKSNTPAAELPSSKEYFESHRIQEFDLFTVKHVFTPSFFARHVTAVESYPDEIVLNEEIGIVLSGSS